MKKHILILFILLSIASFAQDNEWKVSHTKSGNFKIETQDGKYNFSPGGRFTMDGAYLEEDITPLASGTVIKEARLNMGFKVDKMNFLVELDFAKSKVTMKDITVRYNFTDHSFIKAGHYGAAFSANYLTTTEKVAFIGRPATATAFAPRRALGFSYRHYNRYFWFEGGVFGDDVNQTYSGKDGYSVTARLVGIPIEMPNSHLHIGVSGLFGTASSRGLDEDGSGKYNRKLKYIARLQNSIHNQNILAAYIGPSGTDSYGQNDLEDLQNGGAKNHIQLSAEILDVYRNFYWQAEFIGTRVNRIMNKEKILNLERNGGSFPETWSDISYKYGEPRSLNFYGYYVQASYMIFGDNFKYSKYSSTLKRITTKSLQLSARYNYTSLNDIEGELINGKFYTEDGVNQSVAGGITSSYAISLNYVLNANVRFVAEYTDQKLDNYSIPDENIKIFQGRLQVVF